MIRYWLYMLCSLALISQLACTPEEDPFINTVEERADAIRAATPTELPPVTTSGENTMGAYIIPTPGSELHRLAGQDTILFVASGVQRGGSIGTISTSCRPFQNWRYESQEYVSIRGIWCPRPEIGMIEEQALQFRLYDWGGGICRYSFDSDNIGSMDRLRYASDTLAQNDYVVLLNDRTANKVALTFSIELKNLSDSTEKITVTQGRLDAIYGSTP